MNKRSFLQKLGLLPLVSWVDFNALNIFSRVNISPKEKQYTLYTDYKTKTTLDAPRIKITGSKAEILSELERLLKNKITNEECWCTILLCYDNSDKLDEYSKRNDINQYPFYHMTSFSWDRYMLHIRLCFDLVEGKL